MSGAGLGLDTLEALYFPSLGDLQDAAKGQQHRQATVATKGEESALSPDRIHSSHVLKQLEKLATELTTTASYADSSAAQQQTSSTGVSSSTSARSHPPRQSVPHPNSSASTTLSPPPTTADEIDRPLLQRSVRKIDRRPLLVEWRPGVQGDRCRRLAQSALRAEPVQAAIEEICTTAKGARDETALAVAITKLLNHFGVQLQLLLAASLSTSERPSAPSTAEQPTLGPARAPTRTDAARFADLPVRAVERGTLSVTTAGPESNRPDIVLQAKPGKVMCADLCDAQSTTGDGASDAQGQGGPHPWLFYVAAVEVKFKKSDLLATRTVGQIFRYGKLRRPETDTVTSNNTSNTFQKPNSPSATKSTALWKFFISTCTLLLASSFTLAVRPEPGMVIFYAVDKAPNGMDLAAIQAAWKKPCTEQYGGDYYNVSATMNLAWCYSGLTDKGALVAQWLQNQQKDQWTFTKIDQTGYDTD
ncbi:hypothetical protein CBOM_00590 [Ceraceosorus bombacis]|uniref:Uncharacterized protein n=1 Tax=Ceraceosorus bombacis TaxID=401625 RepID=A0A0P1BAZ4_9BASI|nr:hypothetical protein CBOM_00590 [Ceraceosorus bombacis]